MYFQTIARLLITGRDALVKIQDKMAEKQAVSVFLKKATQIAECSPINQGHFVQGIKIIEQEQNAASEESTHSNEISNYVETYERSTRKVLAKTKKSSSTLFKVLC